MDVAVLLLAIVIGAVVAYGVVWVLTPYRPKFGPRQGNYPGKGIG